MKAAKHDEITELTLTEVRRQHAHYEGKRQAITAELAALFKARLAGAKEPVRLTDHEKLARARAREMLNGHASTVLNLPEPTDSEERLQIERDAIGLILRGLESHEAVARAAEAVRWVEANRSAWTQLA